MIAEQPFADSKMRLEITFELVKKLLFLNEFGPWGVKSWLAVFCVAGQLRIKLLKCRELDQHATHFATASVGSAHLAFANPD